MGEAHQQYRLERASDMQRKVIRRSGSKIKCRSGSARQHEPAGRARPTKNSEPALQKCTMGLEKVQLDNESKLEK